MMSKWNNSGIQTSKVVPGKQRKRTGENYQTNIYTRFPKTKDLKLQID